MTQIHNLIGEVSQILLVPADDSILHYASGQYVNVMHSDQSISSLSIACAPNVKHELEFHLFHPPQNLPARDLMRMARQEGIWNIAGPYGDCTDTRLDKNKPIIFIARGTGFASIKAVIEALSRETHPPIYFYWSMPDQSDFYLETLLESWKKNISGFHYSLISADKNPASPQSLCELLISNHKQFSSCQIYSSGSPQFVKAVYLALQPHGLEDKLFYSDMLDVSS